jgi:hypothetical protein
MPGHRRDVLWRLLELGFDGGVVADCTKPGAGERILAPTAL